VNQTFYFSIIQSSNPIPSESNILFFHHPIFQSNSNLIQSLENTNAYSPQSWSESQTNGEPRSGAFGENWIQKCKRLRSASEFGQLLGWDACAHIIKHGDCVLQEQFVMQMLVQFQRIFDKERVPLRLRIYRIMALTSDSGIIEVVPNALSIDKLKQQIEGTTLRNFFLNNNGPTRLISTRLLQILFSLWRHILSCVTFSKLKTGTTAIS